MYVIDIICDDTFFNKLVVIYSEVFVTMVWDVSLSIACIDT